MRRIDNYAFFMLMASVVCILLNLHIGNIERALLWAILGMQSISIFVSRPKDD